MSKVIQYHPTSYTPTAKRAYDLLRSPKLPKHITLETIAEDLVIPFSWMRNFSRGAIADPGAVRCDKLIAYLSKFSEA